MPKYGTLEFSQEFKKMWDADTLLLKLLKGLSTTTIMKVRDHPEMKPIFQRIEDGKVVEIRHAEPEDIARAEFVYDAPMEVWKDILTDKIEPMKAMVSGKLKMKGNITKMSAYMKGWLRQMDLQKKVPTEW